MALQGYLSLTGELLGSSLAVAYAPDLLRSTGGLEPVMLTTLYWYDYHPWLTKHLIISCKQDHTDEEAIECGNLRSMCPYDAQKWLARRESCKTSVLHLYIATPCRP